MNVSDRQLVRRVLAGKEDAFDRFFDDYFPALYRFAMTRLDYNEDAAEEVAQATICRAIGKLATFRGESALFTWLCTFCRHEISAYVRRNRLDLQHVNLVEENPEIRAALELTTAKIEGPEAAANRTEIGRLVLVALDLLPPQYGRALEWKYLEDLSVKQIASRLTLSPKATESLLTRARVAFRDCYSTLIRSPGLKDARMRPMESSS